MIQTKEQLKQVIDSQRAYFKTGETRPLTFRLSQLRRLKQALKAYEQLLLDALAKDLGKHPLESYMTELGLLYHHIDDMLKYLPKWDGRQRVKTPLFLFPAKSYTVNVPYGNTLILSAFNYPLLLSLDPLIGALAGGNTALVALSEQTPHVSETLTAMISDCFPENYLAFYTGSIDMNTFVLAERFDKIFFTGSTRVGKIVLSAASQHLTPVTLELGGKSPAVVTKHADIRTAAERIAWGKCVNAGQTCVAPDYCLVDQEVQEELLSQLQEAVRRMYGEAVQSSPFFGRIVNRSALERLTAFIEADREFLVFGGTADASDSYVSPTILSAHITTELASMREEIFGPILPVLGYDELQQAIDIINDGEAPLAFYPFSEQKNEQQHLLRAVQFGGATVNDTVLHLSNNHLGFGGVGSSGMGRYHGKDSFETFTHKQSILTRGTGIRLPLMYPPYTSKKEGIIRRFLG